MCPTIFRFVPAAEGAEAVIPAAVAASAAELRFSERGTLSKVTRSKVGARRGYAGLWPALCCAGSPSPQRRLPQEARPHYCISAHSRRRRGVVSGSGWFALRPGLTVAAAMSSFVDLAARRWAHVELYNCRSFVRELAALLAAEAASVGAAFDNVYRFVTLEREVHGDRLRG